jgi:hypothetical protein
VLSSRLATHAAFVVAQLAVPIDVPTCFAVNSVLTMFTVHMS